jgi:hypothetical protein
VSSGHGKKSQLFWELPSTFPSVPSIVFPSTHFPLHKTAFSPQSYSNCVMEMSSHKATDVFTSVLSRTNTVFSPNNDTNTDGTHIENSTSYYISISNLRQLTPTNDSRTICIPINLLTLVLNPSAQRCLTRFLLEIFIFEPCISLIYV